MQKHDHDEHDEHDDCFIKIENRIYILYATN